jgi:hypothetical protein
MMNYQQRAKDGLQAMDNVKAWRETGAGGQLERGMQTWMTDHTSINIEPKQSYGANEFGWLHHALANLRAVLQPLLPPPPAFMVMDFDAETTIESWAVIDMAGASVPMGKCFFIGPAKRKATLAQQEAAFLLAWRIETDWIVAPLLCFLLRAVGWDKMRLSEFPNHRNPILRIVELRPRPKGQPAPPDLRLSRREKMLGFELPLDGQSYVIDAIYGYIVKTEAKQAFQPADTDLLMYLLWQQMLDVPKFDELLPACFEAVGKALQLTDVMVKAPPKDPENDAAALATAAADSDADAPTLQDATVAHP